jgi:hypothetical protein
MHTGFGKKNSDGKGHLGKARYRFEDTMMNLGDN